MAIALVGAVQNNAESATGWANGGLEGELAYQGSSSYGAKVGSGTTRFYHTGTTRDFSSGGGNEGDHIIVVLGSLTPGKLDTFANGGLGIFAGESGTVYGEWYVDGSDTKSPTTLFLPYIIDPARDFDNVAGGFTTGGNPAQLDTADTFGGRFDATSGIMGNFNNGLVDQITIGTGLRGTGTGGTLAEWITADEGTVGNRYGFLTTREGVVYFQGKMYFGASGSSYAFSDTDKVIIFPDVPVASDFFEIVVDNASSVVTFDGFTIQAPGAPKVALTLTSGTWNIDNSTIDGARVITGGSGLTLDGTKVTNSGAITQSGATITGGSIINSTATSALIMDDDTLVTGVDFTGNDIAIDATSAIVSDEVNLTGLTFSGNTTDVTVNSANDITINNLSGSNAATCTNTGAGTCSIVSSAPVSVTVTFDGNPVEGAAVYLETVNSDVVLNGLTDASGVVSGSFGGTTPVAIDDTVSGVKAGSDPTPYQYFTLGGQITAIGYDQTALLSED